MSKFENYLLSILPNLQADALSKLYKYYQILQSESKLYNLTTITEEKDVYIKHFYDSLLLSKVVNLDGKTLADIGTGAGFPGLVLSICFPSLRVVLIEPTLKRCKFLQKVIDELNLTNVEVINERAEKLDKKYRETFDYTTARAVSALPILLELLTPFTKTKGQVIAMKGSNALCELADSQKAISTLYLETVKLEKFDLPNECGERNIIVFNKLKQTQNIYPRDYAKIKNKPL